MRVPASRLIEHCFVACRLAQGEKEPSSNVSFLVPPKHPALQPPDLRVETRRVKDRLMAEITAKRFVAFVHVGLRDGYALCPEARATRP